MPLSQPFQEFSFEFAPSLAIDGIVECGSGPGLQKVFQDRFCRAIAKHDCAIPKILNRESRSLRFGPHVIHIAWEVKRNAL